MKINVRELARSQVASFHAPPDVKTPASLIASMNVNLIVSPRRKFLARLLVRIFVKRAAKILAKVSVARRLVSKFAKPLASLVVRNLVRQIVRLLARPVASQLVNLIVRQIAKVLDVRLVARGVVRKVASPLVR